MKTKTKNILIHSTPEKVFAQMDELVKQRLLSCHGIACGLKLPWLKMEQTQNFQSATCRQSNGFIKTFLSFLQNGIVTGV